MKACSLFLISRTRVMCDVFFVFQDILFDSTTHLVKKFVLHTNFPGHYNFNMQVAISVCLSVCPSVCLEFRLVFFCLFLQFLRVCLRVLFLNQRLCVCVHVWISLCRYHRCDFRIPLVIKKGRRARGLSCCRDNKREPCSALVV